MCGIIGVLNQSRPAAQDLYVGLWALQPRGKESAKIVIDDNGKITEEGGMGEVPQAFWGKDLNLVSGKIGIGQVRYSTAGGSNSENAPPIRGKFQGIDFYIAHNGNIVNVRELCDFGGIKLKDNENYSDTRLIAELISKSKKEDFYSALVDVLERIKGGFSLIILFNGKVYAVRDSFGFHPLQLGIRKEGYVVASESCAFSHLGAKILEDISPGKLVVLSKNSYDTFVWSRKSLFRFDLFEKIYFLRPDSIVHNTEAGKARYFTGWSLAEVYPIDADIIAPVPDSGNEAAHGYYESRLERGDKIKFRPYALFRPHTVSRTFIEPIHEKREEYLNLKFNPRPDQVRGNRIVLVDDSIVRGTTIKVVAKILRQAGAKEIHVLVASPMYLFPDFYGIDTYRAKDKIIARRNEGDIKKVFEEINRGEGKIDSLGYSSLNSTISAVLKAGGIHTGFKEDTFYTGPFTGEYPDGTGDFKVN